VGGDARAHGSGTQNGDFVDHFHEDIAPLSSTTDDTNLKEDFKIPIRQFIRAR
jgi:hypothetical protein